MLYFFIFFRRLYLLYPNIYYRTKTLKAELITQPLLFILSIIFIRYITENAVLNFRTLRAAPRDNNVNKEFRTICLSYKTEQQLNV